MSRDFLRDIFGKTRCCRGDRNCAYGCATKADNRRSDSSHIAFKRTRCLGETCLLYLLDLLKQFASVHFDVARIVEQFSAEDFFDPHVWRGGLKRQSSGCGCMKWQGFCGSM